MNAIAANPAPTTPAFENFAPGAAAPVKVGGSVGDSVCGPEPEPEPAPPLLEGIPITVEEVKVTQGVEEGVGVGVGLEDGVTMMGLLEVVEVVVEVEVRVGVGVEEVVTLTVMVVVRVEVMDWVSPATSAAPPFATEARAGVRATVARRRVLRSCILIVVLWI
ncbi:hypothetical protein BJY04DRAFT_201930, partial [Aspergillus karnatakaensis]|uniref:uncharacterized protein n=1 Tax=Aspergillus karnatakaensis TaxID=1810916 RepID=UPI003CCD82D3